MIRDMLVRPCPICRKPVPWETAPWRPFCSKRCKMLDLGAWSAGDYTLPESISEEEVFSEGNPPPDGLDP
jgi:uncharacterized protein